jgi:branched-chain amino acid transport system permease protein
MRKFFETHRNATALLVVGVIFLLLPLQFGNPYQLTVLIFIGVNTMLTLGLNLVMGYAGQVSLGQATFYGLGAYATGILTVHYGWPPIVALPVAILFTALLAWLLGIAVLRLKGNYLALATLGLNVIVFLMFKQQGELTGGTNGLRGIPNLTLGPLTAESDLDYYYVIYAALLGLIALSLNIVGSRTGRALRAVHNSEVAAETLGVNANRLKLQIFTVSAAYAGLAGGLYAMWLGFISPATFTPLVSIHIIVMSAIGGLASVWGAFFGAATITLLGEWLDVIVETLLQNASGEQEIIAEGLILVVIMIFVPDGLAAGIVRLVRDWWRSRGRERGEAHVPA